MNFDKTKPYGQIFGEFGIARFEQNGHYYDAQYNLLDDKGQPLKKTAAPAAPEKSSAQGGDANSTSDEGSASATTTPAPADTNKPTKEQLIAEAKSLGINANKNWGEAKIRDAIAAKKATAPASNEEGSNPSVDSQVSKSLG
jgi:hypothetical protein